MIKATTTTLWHLLRPTQKYIGTLSSSHTTHAHTPPSTPQPAHQHVQQAETRTPQPARRKHAPNPANKNSERISTPTTNTTHNQITAFPVTGRAASATTKNTTHPTHTPQTPSTQPQNTHNKTKKGPHTRPLPVRAIVGNLVDPSSDQLKPPLRESKK